jgi:electron transfer flavoprotein-quinone oxidoreductase
MANDNIFDAIIVGAGPAGTTAAFVLAKAGMNVALLERGPAPGAKNVFGGILYATVLNRLIPNFWEQAPMERHIKATRIFLISQENAVSIGVESLNHNKPPYNNSFTVSRAHFDNWYASRAEEAGALLLTNTVVDDLLKYRGKVIGVKVRGEEGELYADTVIVADGVNSLLAEKAGLRKPYARRQVSMGMKEIIELPRSVIEDRFGLSGHEGVELKYIAGDATKGIWGGGNIYTNLESLSLVTWVAVEPLVKSKLKATDIFEQFKEHPFVKPYIKDGKTVEYQAHLAPDGGYDATPQYFTDGLMIAGDAARFLNASIHYEGTNFAMASGEAAAKTFLKAHQNNDYSAKSLAYYQTLLNESFVMKDLRRYRRMNYFAEKNPEFFGPYLDVITRAAVDFFAVKEMPKRVQEWQMTKDVWKNLRKASSSKFPVLSLIWKAIKGAISFI